MPRIPLIIAQYTIEGHSFRTGTKTLHLHETKPTIGEPHWPPEQPETQPVRSDISYQIVEDLGDLPQVHHKEVVHHHRGSQADSKNNLDRKTSYWEMEKVWWDEMKREMTPRLANTSRAKGKRRVEVPNVGTSSNRLASEPLTDDAPRPNESRQESEQQPEVRPEDSASQLGSQGNGTGRPPGHNDTQSQVSSTGSKACAQEYQRDLRRRIALDMLYRDDTMNNGVSTIPKQNIDYEDDFGFNPKQPKVRINWKRIPDEEIDGYWDEYPEIIKKLRNQDNMNRESTAQGRYLDPLTSRYGGQAHRPRQNTAGGYTPPNNGCPQASASPERNPRRDDSSPPPKPRHVRVGNGDREESYDRGPGTRGTGGGGPPSEPPSPGGDGDSSLSESEDDRCPEEDPTATIVETYDYDPRPRSEEEVLQALFYRYEQQIMFYLHGPPLNQNLAAQKAILQNVPKPSKWNGESDYTRFDEWILGLIQWMNIADQCGPPTRFSQTRSAHILTSVDLIRTNTLGSYLEGNALRWFRDEVQKVLDGFSTSRNLDPLSYRWTFMQVVNGLYQQFIHEASISQVADKFNKVTYNRKDGAKVMFSELKRWAAAYQESTLPYSESKIKETEKGYTQRERNRSPKHLQIVDKRRYSIPDHEQIRKDNSTREKGYAKRAGTSSEKPAVKRGLCFDCGEYDDIPRN
ncbi:hypothetical protein F5050DRAFT_1872348, partial [Lentinula boryana]